MTYLPKKSKKYINEEWQVCRDCWIMKERDEFFVKSENQLGHTTICMDCEDLKKLWLTKELRIQETEKFDKMFFEHPQIINNLKIVSDITFSNKDKYEFLHSIWEDKKWLRLVYNINEFPKFEF